MTEQPPQPERFVDEENERVRRERIRRDAARPMSVNLEEGIALSATLSRFAGAGVRAAHAARQRRPS